jgi:hypothetical protein
MESTLKLAEERSFNVTEGRTLVQKFMAMEHHEAALRALMRLATLAERKHELTVDEVEYNRQQQADEVLVLQSMFPSDFVEINQTECELSAYMVCILLLDVKLASLSLLCQMDCDCSDAYHSHCCIFF